MERDRKFSFVLSDKGGACSFSHVASATEYLPSRWPAVSGDTNGPSFSRHFAETGTRFLEERKKVYGRQKKKNCEKALRVDAIIVRNDGIFELDFPLLLSDSLW